MSASFLTHFGQDGFIVKSEMKKFIDSVGSSGSSVDKIFAMADSNKDDKVSLEEFGKFFDVRLPRASNGVAE